MFLFRPRFFLPLAALTLATAVRAAEALGAPAPLTVAPAASAPGERLAELANAQRMLELGYATDAARVFAKLLAEPETPGTDHNALVLLLVSARLNQGDTVAAERVLGNYRGTQTASYHLRAGLIAARQGQLDTARMELKATSLAALPASEGAWFYFLQGMVADAEKDPEHQRRALLAYDQAEKLAGSEAQRARITVAREQARLGTGDASEAKAAGLLAAARLYPGKNTSYVFVRLYATELFALRHTAEAVQYLQAELRGLPAAQRAERDNLWLLLGVGAGAKPGAGRDALKRLLDEGENAGHQRAALQLLADASQDEPERGEFRAVLDALISRKTAPHPILAELLLASAQLALKERGWKRAEDDATELLTKVSDSHSPLTVTALGVLLAVSWEKKSYRQAANYAEKARDGLPAAEAGLRADLSVLVAEARFRAGEAEDDPKLYKDAADAYATARHERPAGIMPGALIFQQSLALTRAGLRDDAGSLLDSFAGDAPLDPASRWQAEWNLARALKTAGQAHQENLRKALSRVARLLAEGGTPGGFPAELRAQMGWLQARLTLDAGEAAQALVLAQALYIAVIDMAGLETKQRDHLAAHALLLQALATFAQAVPPDDEKAEAARDEQALALLKKLWDEHPKAEAALQAYFVGADYFVSKERKDIVGAQDLLQKAVINFPDDNVNAPRALFKKAVLEVSRGQKVNYEKALEMFDQLLGNKQYADRALEFIVRRKQAELQTELGEYSKAQDIYLSLTQQFVGYPQMNEIQLALADVYRAQGQQGQAGAGQLQQAESIYRRLCDQADASAEVRTEAFLKLGELLRALGDNDGAAGTWLRLKATFLPDAPAVAPELGGMSRISLNRALMLLGELFVEEGRLENALDTFDMIERYDLPSAEEARRRRGELGGLPSPGK